MSGIVVKMRLSKEYFISKSYFELIDKMYLALNSIPIKSGDKPVNVDKRNLDKVIKINFSFETNHLESLEIKSGFKSKIISADRIIRVGEKNYYKINFKLMQLFLFLRIFCNHYS